MLFGNVCRAQEGYKFKQITSVRQTTLMKGLNKNSFACSGNRYHYNKGTSNLHLHTLLSFFIEKSRHAHDFIEKFMWKWQLWEKSTQPTDFTKFSDFNMESNYICMMCLALFDHETTEFQRKNYIFISIILFV